MAKVWASARLQTNPSRAALHWAATDDCGVQDKRPILLKRRRYQAHPDRYEYLLTEKAYALAPVVLALRSWGKRFTKGPDTSQIVHKACGGSIEPGFHCTKCLRRIEKTEISPARLYEGASQRAGF